MTQKLPGLPDRLIFVLLACVVLINATGLVNEIFLGDSALYAYISKTMVENGDYLNLYVQGNDWLDKPHFPFWVTAISFKFFGINPVAYRLPSLLFFLVSLIYTFKLARRLYNEKVALYAILLFGVSLHILVSNNDVRAEAILIGLIMGGVYHMYRMIDDPSFKHFSLAALFSAAAIMTKGIFVLIVLYSAVGGYLLFNRSIRDLLKWKWIRLLLVTFLLLFPELLALYLQFDLYPEKIVFGQQNISGIYFFLWDSQFGRFFNTGPIKGEGDPGFFLHTMLWAFAPWAVWAYMALGKTIQRLINRENHEFLTLFGFLIMFMAFSLSRFQLPHYLNILFPFLAILSVDYIFRNQSSNLIAKIGNGSLIGFMVVYLLVIGLLEWYFRPHTYVFETALLMVCLTLIGIVYGLFRPIFSQSLILRTILATLAFGAYMNLRFYPTLLSYQSGSHVAEWIMKDQGGYKVYSFHRDYLMDLYMPLDKMIYVDDWIDIPIPQDEPIAIYGNDSQAQALKNHASFEVVDQKEFDHFHITGLTPEFLSYKTRNKTLEKRWIWVVVQKE